MTEIEAQLKFLFHNDDVAVELSEFDILIGKTLTKVERSLTDDGEDQIEFTEEDGTRYRLAWYRDCCEDVYIEDIAGDLNDLVGSPILKASEDSSEDSGVDLGHRPPRTDYGDNDDSWTWTFYNIATIKGTVTIRWYGCSNGFYSEEVMFVKVADEFLSDINCAEHSMT